MSSLVGSLALPPKTTRLVPRACVAGTRTTKVLIQEALEKVTKCVEVARSALDMAAPVSGVHVVISKPAQVPKSDSKTLQHRPDSGE